MFYVSMYHFISNVNICEKFYKRNCKNAHTGEPKNLQEL